MQMSDQGSCQQIRNLIEMLLKFFICKVDTELLKTTKYAEQSAVPVWKNTTE